MCTVCVFVVLVLFLANNGSFLVLSLVLLLLCLLFLGFFVYEFTFSTYRRSELVLMGNVAGRFGCSHYCWCEFTDVWVLILNNKF